MIIVEPDSHYSFTGEFIHLLMFHLPAELYEHVTLCVKLPVTISV